MHPNKVSWVRMNMQNNLLQSSSRDLRVMLLRATFVGLLRRNAAGGGVGGGGVINLLFVSALFFPHCLKTIPPPPSPFHAIPSSASAMDGAPEDQVNKVAVLHLFILGPPEGAPLPLHRHPNVPRQAQLWRPLYGFRNRLAQSHRQYVLGKDTHAPAAP